MICYFFGLFSNSLTFTAVITTYIQAYSTGLFKVGVICSDLSFSRKLSTMISDLSYLWLDFRTFFFTRSAWTVGPLDDLVVLQ